jgi:hypothetical protein
MTEKHYGVITAEKALKLIIKAKPVLNKDDYSQIYNLFYRTLLTVQLYEATATSYFGYRIYARGGQFQTKSLKDTMKKSLHQMLLIASEIDNYKEEVPAGQWNWHDDAATARKYHKLITQTGWKEYNNVVYR